MFRRKNTQRPRERATEYATCKDFQQIFTEDMVGLHRLAFLLTADEGKAEQCFVAGLEESIRGNPVFRQWARTWSKRAIIQNAIKMIAPAPPRNTSVDGTAAPNVHNGSDPESTASDVAAWEPFERFVFVMAVLEGYSLRECSTLLACPVQDVMAAKSLALQRLAGQNPLEPAASTAAAIPWKEAAFARAQVA
jgi:DNA-directed RNA polymerase specialized sigma24 family protein